MKKMMILAMMMVMTISANAMSYNAAKNEALFLSDKMAYELNLTAAQYEAVYEINLDYLMSLNGHADVFGIWWDRRNTDLRFVLTPWQYDKYVALNHFYRPVAWKAGGWTFAVYTHYNRGHFYNAHPKVFVSIYCECPATSLPSHRAIEVGECHILVELPVVQHEAEVSITAIPPDAEYITVSVQAHQVVEIDLIDSLILCSGEVELVSHLVREEEGFVLCCIIAHCVG